ncbi:ABC transporter permease [Clostridium botulinum]|uniref:ABC transporter permease n=1 Tax=Clostridium botulinum TaxID=1491 RepID=UPI0007E1B4F3|nr:ABC transporter permease [Clostridium botulinum]KEJ01726.1 spermidine/putrescine ABC transporter permease [Clostridium botulinum F 357]
MWGKFSNAFSNIFKKQLHNKNTDIILEEDKEGIRGKLKRSTPIFKTVGPVALWLITFFIVPLLLVLVVSFLSRGEYGDVRLPFTLKNYKRLMDPMYGQILIKTLMISISTTLGCLIIGYPFAYFIGRSNKKYRGILLLLVILPFWTNSLVRTYAWIILLKTEGVINTYLMKFGLIHSPLQMLYTDGAVFIGMLYIMLPFMILPIYTSIEKLDMSYVEAANDLGASPYKTFKEITLPLTLPGIIAGCMLVFIPTLGYFFISDLMGGSKTMLISNLIKNQFLTSRDWPFGSAIAVILIILMLIAIGFYFKGNKPKKGIKEVS